MQFKLTRRFARKENGSLSVEAVFALPMLVWAVTATFVFWDAFKTLNISQKATYTIADMLSRERNAIDADYLQAMQELFGFLNQNGRDNGLRVSVVSMNVDQDTGERTMSLEWSEGTGGQKGHTSLDAIIARIPQMAHGDQLILVESFQRWEPQFKSPMQPFTFRETAVTRPRFAPQLKWTDGTTTTTTNTGGDGDGGLGT